MPPPICALCGQEAQGYATNEDGRRLCHTEQLETDCYRLWTVYGARPPVVQLVAPEASDAR